MRNGYGNYLASLVTILFVFIGYIVAFSSLDNSNKLTSGEVYEKNHNEPYTSTNMIPVCTSAGKIMSCVPVPYKVHHEENWEIKIKQYDETNNEWLTATYYVTESEYNLVQVGNQFEYDKKSMLDEAPVIKEKQ